MKITQHKFLENLNVELSTNVRIFNVIHICKQSAALILQAYMTIHGFQTLKSHLCWPGGESAKLNELDNIHLPTKYHPSLWLQVSNFKL